MFDRIQVIKNSLCWTFHIGGESPCTVVAVTPRFNINRIREIEARLQSYVANHHEAIRKDPILHIPSFFHGLNIDAVVFFPLEYTI